MKINQMKELHLIDREFSVSYCMSISAKMHLLHLQVNVISPRSLSGKSFYGSMRWRIRLNASEATNR